MSAVNTTQGGFTVDSILFETHDFVVAYGRWQGGDTCLGMRWKGKNGAVGFPNSFGNPVWFLIPDELESPIAKALLGLKSTKRDDLLKVLPDFV